jgi:hypothetical protein
MIFRRLVARWRQRKINRWLGFVAVGFPVDVALSRAGLSPERALAILEPTLYGRLSTVGLITFTVGGKGCSFADDRSQLVLVLQSIASLIPFLRDTEQQRLRALLEKLRGHDWGYVREAAYDALAAVPVGVP